LDAFGLALAGFVLAGAALVAVLVAALVAVLVAALVGVFVGALVGVFVGAVFFAVVLAG
jgi:hypothetical protein